MPSAYGPSNGHLVNTGSMVLTNGGQAGQTSASPHHHGVSGGIGGHSSHHSQQQSQILTNEECGIREVWANNLEEEFARIRIIVQHYPFIAMDTEFPGVVARPIGSFNSNSDYLYQIMRVNIQLLKIIQLGLTFMDREGKKPPGCSTWQFNFKFNINEDMFAQESIDLLTNSGIQFTKHDQEGIDSTEFAVLLIGSGVVLSENICWLSFHSGYDFGYLLKLLTDQLLPKRESEFFELLKIYFPKVYDLKYLMKSTKDLKGGLQEVAEQLDLTRKGPQHQAGSDSLLTGETFFKLREMYFENDIEEKRYAGFIYGLETAETGKVEQPEDEIYLNNFSTSARNTNGTSATMTTTSSVTTTTSSTVTNGNQISAGTTINNNNGITLMDELSTTTLSSQATSNSSDVTPTNNNTTSSTNGTSLTTTTSSGIASLQSLTTTNAMPTVSASS